MPGSRRNSMHSRRNSLEFIPTSAPKIDSAVDRNAPDVLPAETDEETKYFHNNPAPDYLPEIKKQVSEFVKFHAGKRPIALVTVSWTSCLFFFFTSLHFSKSNILTPFVLERWNNCSSGK